MKKLTISTLAICAAVSSTAMANVENQKNQLSDKQKLSVYAEAGVRTDELKWNIASDLTGTKTPNILSELSWNNLKSRQITIGGNLPVKSFGKNNLYLNGNIGYGDIYSGDNQDSDYLGNNRSLEFSRSNNKSDKGSVNDYSVSLNLEIPFNYRNHNFAVIPAIGYSIHEQNLTMTDGIQTVPNLGAFNGLNSSYDTKWEGGFLGLTLEHNIKKHHFALGHEYHKVDYYAEANWNLRSDFQHPKSFAHEADGTGSVYNFKYAYKLNEKITYNISYKLQQWETDAGTDTLYFANGTISKTRLNKVEWNSEAVNLGISYIF